MPAARLAKLAVSQPCSLILSAINVAQRVAAALDSTFTPTSERLGYDPIALDDGLERLVRWLRDLDRID